MITLPHFTGHNSSPFLSSHAMQLYKRLHFLPSLYTKFNSFGNLKKNLMIEWLTWPHFSTRTTTPGVMKLCPCPSLSLIYTIITLSCLISHAEEKCVRPFLHVKIIHGLETFLFTVGQGWGVRARSYWIYSKNTFFHCKDPLFSPDQRSNKDTHSNK